MRVRPPLEALAKRCGKCADEESRRSIRQAGETIPEPAAIGPARMPWADVGRMSQKSRAKAHGARRAVRGESRIAENLLEAAKIDREHRRPHMVVDLAAPIGMMAIGLRG